MNQPAEVVDEPTHSFHTTSHLLLPDVLPYTDQHSIYNKQLINVRNLLLSSNVYGYTFIVNSTQSNQLLYVNTNQLLQYLQQQHTIHSAEADTTNDPILLTNQLLHTYPLNNSHHVINDLVLSNDNNVLAVVRDTTIEFIYLYTLNSPITPIQYKHNTSIIDIQFHSSSYSQLTVLDIDYTVTLYVISDNKVNKLYTYNDANIYSMYWQSDDTIVLLSNDSIIKCSCMLKPIDYYDLVQDDEMIDFQAHYISGLGNNNYLIGYRELNEDNSDIDPLRVCVLVQNISDESVTMLGDVLRDEDRLQADDKLYEARYITRLIQLNKWNINLLSSNKCAELGIISQISTNNYHQLLVGDGSAVPTVPLDPSYATTYPLGVTIDTTNNISHIMKDGTFSTDNKSYPIVMILTTDARITVYSYIAEQLDTADVMHAALPLPNELPSATNQIKSTESLESKSLESMNSPVAEPVPTKSTTNAFSAAQPKGGWNCEICEVNNPVEVSICRSCEAPKPGEPVKLGSNTDTNKSSSGFTFGSTQSISSTPFTFGNTSTSSSSLTFPSSSDTKSTDQSFTQPLKSSFTFGTSSDNQLTGKTDDTNKSGGLSWGNTSSTKLSFGVPPIDSTNTNKPIDSKSAVKNNNSSPETAKAYATATSVFQQLEQSATSSTTAVPSSSITTKSFNAFAAAQPKGGWNCAECDVNNPDGVVQCRSCEAIKSGAHPTKQSLPAQAFTFGATNSSNNNNCTAAITQPSSGGLSFGVSAANCGSAPSFTFAASIDQSAHNQNADKLSNIDNKPVAEFDSNHATKPISNSGAASITQQATQPVSDRPPAKFTFPSLPSQVMTGEQQKLNSLTVVRQSNIQPNDFDTAVKPDDTELHFRLALKQTALELQQLSELCNRSQQVVASCIHNKQVEGAPILDVKHMHTLILHTNTLLDKCTQLQSELYNSNNSIDQQLQHITSSIAQCVFDAEYSEKQLQQQTNNQQVQQLLTSQSLDPMSQRLHKRITTTANTLNQQIQLLESHVNSIYNALNNNHTAVQQNDIHTLDGLYDTINQHAQQLKHIKQMIHRIRTELHDTPLISIVKAKQVLLSSGGGSDNDLSFDNAELIDSNQVSDANQSTAVTGQSIQPNKQSLLSVDTARQLAEAFGNQLQLQQSSHNCQSDNHLHQLLSNVDSIQSDRNSLPTLKFTSSNTTSSSTAIKHWSRTQRNKFTTPSATIHVKSPIKTPSTNTAAQPQSTHKFTAPVDNEATAGNNNKSVLSPEIPKFNLSSASKPPNNILSNKPATVAKQAAPPTIPPVKLANHPTADSKKTISFNSPSATSTDTIKSNDIPKSAEPSKQSSFTFTTPSDKKSLDTKPISKPVGSNQPTSAFSSGSSSSTSSAAAAFTFSVADTGKSIDNKPIASSNSTISTTPATTATAPVQETRSSTFSFPSPDVTTPSTTSAHESSSSTNGIGGFGGLSFGTTSSTNNNNKPSPFQSAFSFSDTNTSSNTTRFGSSTSAPANSFGSIFGTTKTTPQPSATFGTTPQSQPSIGFHTSSQPAFGFATTASSAPSFGSSVSFGNNTSQSPQPVFGQTSAFGAQSQSGFGTFGASRTLGISGFTPQQPTFGSTNSVFGQPAQPPQQQQITPNKTFGSGFTQSTGSPFAALAQQAPASGFAAFGQSQPAQPTGFAQASQQSSGWGSGFGSSTATPSFSTNSSAFGNIRM